MSEMGKIEHIATCSAFSVHFTSGQDGHRVDVKVHRTLSISEMNALQRTLRQIHDLHTQSTGIDKSKRHCEQGATE